jgi:hypothetical protein
VPIGLTAALLTRGWWSWQVAGALAVALGLVLGFVVVELHSRFPLVPLGILHLRSLRVANLYTVMIGAWVAAELLVVPLYLQLVLHYFPLLAGLAIVPQGVVGFLGASMGARTVCRVGLGVLLVVSGISAAAGLLVLGLVLVWRIYPLLAIGFMLTGYGTAVGAFAGTVSATQGIDDPEQGLAGGLVNMSRQVGAALGVAFAAAVIGPGAVSGGAVASDRATLLLASTAALVAAVLGLRRIRSPSAGSFVGSSSMARTDPLGAGGRAGEWPGRPPAGAHRIGPSRPGELVTAPRDRAVR